MHKEEKYCRESAVKLQTVFTTTDTAAALPKVSM